MPCLHIYPFFYSLYFNLICLVLLNIYFHLDGRNSFSVISYLGIIRYKTNINSILIDKLSKWIHVAYWDKDSFISKTCNYMTVLLLEGLRQVSTPSCHTEELSISWQLPGWLCEECGWWNWLVWLQLHSVAWLWLTLVQVSSGLIRWDFSNHLLNAWIDTKLEFA